MPNSPTSPHSTPWCEIIYREYEHRLGSTAFPVASAWTRVFSGLMDAPRGMCLSFLHRSTNSQRLIRARQKIGEGLIVERDPSCGSFVWLHNSSLCAIFVGIPSRGDQVVCRLMPGMSAKLGVSFDENCRMTSEPVDCEWVRSIRVSFGKGWGVGYQRRSIISCPCWVDIVIYRQ